MGIELRVPWRNELLLVSSFGAPAIGIQITRITTAARRNRSLHARALVYGVVATRRAGMRSSNDSRESVDVPRADGPEGDGRRRRRRLSVVTRVLSREWVPFAKVAMQPCCGV